MTDRKRALVRDLILVGFIVVFAVIGYLHQRAYYDEWWEGSGKYIQRVNLPNAEQIKVAALGYDNLYADFLTLRAVQMFGAAWETEDRSVRPIYNYFDILTTLDPTFAEVYELSNLVLSDEHGELEEGLGHKLALDILRKGIRKNRDTWRLPYLGMYTALYGMEDPELAQEFLLAAEAMPSTPDYVLRMDEFIARQSGKYFAAFDINLSHYLQYYDEGLEAEMAVAYRKFGTILDSWYRLEMARAAQSYYEGTGEYPADMETLLQSDYVPVFEAPTIRSLNAALDEFDLPGVDMLDYVNEIREAALIEITGVPPEPTGTWYWIDTVAVAEKAETGPPDMDLRLEQRHDYFATLRDSIEIIDGLSRRAQEFIVTFMRENDGEKPTHEDVFRFLAYDGAGGHFVYIRDVDEDEFPRYFSTTQKRLIERTDPRLGFTGTLDDLPPRRYPLTDDQPPYLTLQPSIWDFPPDQEWALCRGLEPTVRIEENMEASTEVLRNAPPSVNCSEGIEPPQEPAVLAAN